METIKVFFIIIIILLVSIGLYAYHIRLDAVDKCFSECEKYNMVCKRVELLPKFIYTCVPETKEFYPLELINYSI